jgi:hypothetical protein
MIHRVVTPLDVERFFSGSWRGHGESVPAIIIRWIIPRERLQFEANTLWKKNDVWQVEESFRFASGHVIHRKMDVEKIGSRRLRVRAADMPGGAEIDLHEHGFRFTPYTIVAKYRRITWWLRRHDECVIHGGGNLRDTIKMSLLGIPVAHLVLTVAVTGRGGDGVQAGTIGSRSASPNPDNNANL